ncbi:MAG: RNA-binding protein [Bacteroidetes bacterium]|nr:RNA-binding protein [Bacteroidota bacterium]
MNIYVSNLSFNLRDEDLRDLFVAYGEVSSARIIMDKMTNRSRGFGFVEMVDDAAGRKAIAELNGATIGGRPVKVNESNPKPATTYSNQTEKNYNNSNSYNQNIY